MAFYRHIVLDKDNVGASHIRNSLHLNGLQTAEARGITLAAGSQALQHHRHVFLWDETANGVKGRMALLSTPGDVVEVIVNWPILAEPTIFDAGTLRGDGGHFGPPSGSSTNGAWAYPGSIPRKWIFIVGLDSELSPGWESWRSGAGWPAAAATST